jgi:ectoine hydroxylase-related dioxygenase (phytanoyl-CoA dioxygenase family)
MNPSLSQNVDKYGFAIVDVFDEREIDSLFNILKRTHVAHSRAGVRHLLADAAVRSFAAEERLTRIASEVLTADAIPFRATLFDKSQDANWQVTWHQDTALPLREKKETAGWGPWSVKEGIHYAHATTQALQQVIALRIHLDPSTESNGPLKVIPETHRLGVISDEEVSRIASQRSGVECLAKKGSVLAMRPLLIHSSSKSKDKSPRRVLHIEYASNLSIADGLTLAMA